MSITASQLVAEVKTQGVDQAKKDLTSVGETSDHVGGLIHNVLGGAFFALGNMAVQGLQAVGGQLVDTVKVAMAHQQIMAQTTQVIKSTGDVSGMSAASIDDLATSLSKVTTFSEDTVQGGENLLLTFTGIGKQVFPEATQAMLDMSQAMGQDIKSSAIQLGKAINDPINGMSALQRVGVTFSDSEKEQIKTMMAHNNIIGAQKVMLHELSTEFGGSAQAAGKTFAGSLMILKNNFEDLKVKIGTAVLPLLASLAQFANTELPRAFNDVGKAVEYVKNVLRTLPLNDFKEAWQAVSGELGSIIYTFHKLWDAINPLKDVGTDFDPIANAIATIAKAGLDTITTMLWNLSQVLMTVDRTTQGGGLSGLAGIFRQIGSTIGNLSPAVNLFEALQRHAQDLGKWFQSSVVPALKQAEPGFANLGRAVLGLLPVIEQISQIVHNTFQKAFDALLPVFEKAVPVIIQLSGIIANGLAAAIKFLAPYIVQAVAAIGKFADEVVQRVAPILMQFFASLKTGLDWLQANWKYIWPVLSRILQGVWDVIVGIVQVAWSVVSGIIKIGLDLLSGNWKQAWNDLIDMLKGVWGGIGNIIKGGLNLLAAQFVALPAKAVQWGEDMISGFISGIQNMLGSLGSTVSNVAGVISSHLHFSKPDVGPLADADTWGPDFIDLFSKGILAGVPKLKAAIGQVTAPLNLSASGALPQGASAISSNFAQSVAASQPTQQPIVQPILMIDGHVIGRVLMPAITDQLRGRIPVGVKLI